MPVDLGACEQAQCFYCKAFRTLFYEFTFFWDESFIH